MGSHIFDRRWAASRLSHIVHLLCFLHWKRQILSVWRLLCRGTHKTSCRIVEMLFEDEECYHWHVHKSILLIVSLLVAYHSYHTAVKFSYSLKVLGCTILLSGHDIALPSLYTHSC